MILGHEQIISDLKRLAPKGGLAHGYLFFGPSGVGKKLVALSLASHLEGGHFEPAPLLNDALFIKPDEMRTIGIDATRAIKYFLWQKPNKSIRRTVVIDEAEFLTNEAQNALLKIAEEPPASSLLILIVEDPENLRLTLSSRLQKIYFATVKKDALISWLISDLKLKESAAGELARKSFGRPGLAYNLTKDKKFKALLAASESILKSAPLKRRDAIKNLISKDGFDFEAFLDVMIIQAAAGDWRVAKKSIFWHKLLALRDQAHHFNLNPRLQLESLLTNA